MIKRGLAVILAAFAIPLAGGAAAVDDNLAFAGVAAATDPGANEGAGTTKGYVTLRNAVTPTAAQPTEDDTEVAAMGDNGSCLKDMVLVEGSYCTEVRHNCKRWLDDPSLQYARCGEYEEKATCTGKRVQKRYCIDKYEATLAGESLPANQLSFVKGSKLCKSEGKRLCLESEWNFACEGEEMRPYPYGWSREPKCNQDRTDLYAKDVRSSHALKDNRQPRDANPQCASPFGVQNMVGNVDETTLRDNAQYAHPFRNALKGGWWMAGRNRCRPATTAHDDYYEDIQIGVRCCADPPGDDDIAKG